MKKGPIAANSVFTDKAPGFLVKPNLELLMFGGKGGVGKTTSAVASSIHIAEQFPQKKILLASIDPAHSISDSLLGFKGFDNLEFLEINADESLKRFKEAHQEKLKTIASRGTFLDDGDISQFLSLSMPGLDEVMAIMDIIELLNSSRFDMVVLDTAPTGHTLRLLYLPTIIQSWLKAMDSMMAKHRYMKMLYAGKYSKDEIDDFLDATLKDVKRLDSLLQDQNKCEFVPVIIPEKLAIQETLRLLASLEQHKIYVRNIIVNRVYEYNTCSFCKSQRIFHSMLLEDTENLFNKYNLIKIPLYQNEIHGIEALNEYRLNLKSIWKRKREDGEIDDLRANGYKLNSQPGTQDDVPAEIPVPLSSSARYQGLSNQQQTLYPVMADQLQIILMGGKGGVGKSTLSCAIALHISKKWPEKKILVASTDPAHSLSDCLNTHVCENGKELSKNLVVLEINAEKEFAGLKKMYEVEIQNMFDSLFDNTIIDLEFDKDVMERLLDLSPPGLDEVMALTKIIDFIEEERYDIIILDMAPTGHLIRFLELPDLIEEWIKAFFNIFLKYGKIFRVPRFKTYLIQLSKKIKKLRKILVDPLNASFFPIAIPTEMALEETKDLISALKRLKISYPAILLNMVTPVNNCGVCNTIRRNEEEVIRAYYKLFTKEKLHLIFHCEGEPRGIQELDFFGSKIFS